MSKHKTEAHLATISVHGGHEDRVPGAPVVPPIIQSSTFYWATPDDGELLYSRFGNNPNQNLVGAKVAAIEGTEAGVALGSGMAAVAMTLLALTKAGDHIVAGSGLYGATHALLHQELPRRGVETTFVDPDMGEWEKALLPETRLLYIEIPVNPTLRILDPRPIIALAKEKGVHVVCDATFSSPVNFRAADLGIDVVVQSATKYLGGHSDLIAGVVTGPSEVIDEVTKMSRLYGPSLDPNAAWLLDRGIRTLDVRLKRHNENAMAVARFFESRSEVERVLYPGLESHPDHEIAQEIMNGFGGMVSIVLKGGGEAADDFMEHLKLGMCAPSLGGVETLVSQPRYTSHAGLTPDLRRAQGIPDGFVRLSIGIEAAEDLIADFEQALAG